MLFSSSSLYGESKQRLSLAERIPLLQVLSDNCTIITKNSSLVQVIKLNGRNYSGVSVDELEDLFNKRKAFLDTISSKVGLTIFNLRKRVSVDEEKVSYGNKWADKINLRLTKSFKNIYRTEIYIVIRLSIGSLIKDPLGIGSKDFADEEIALNSKISEISAKTEEIIRLLDVYQPKKLLREAGSKNGLLSFWSYITNVGKKITNPEQSQYLGRILAISDLEFFANQGIIKIHDEQGVRYAAILGINAYPHETHSGLLDRMMQVRHPFTIMQQVLPESQEAVKGVISDMISSMQSVMNVPLASGFLYNRMDELEEVGNLVDSGDSKVLKHTFSILVYGDTEKDLETGIYKVKTALAQNGVSIIRERLNLENVFWSQFPDHELLNEARQYMVTTHNVADFITFGTSYEGLQECAFGKDPVTYFKTRENTQFAFTFHASNHEQAAGHTMLIGPTGSGKSVLAMHLIQSCLKYDHENYGNPLKTLIFDSGQGLKIPTEVFGGEYINANIPEKIPMNPLLLENSPSNRLFLQEWIAMLVGGQESLSPKDQEIISRAVNESYELPKTERCLHSLRVLFMERINNDEVSFYDRIKKWLPQEDDVTKYPNSIAAFFNSNRNILDFSSRIIGFDMSEALKNPELLPPMASFIFHSFKEYINTNPSPHICFVDEMAQYLENDIFAPFILKLVRESRKRNGVFFGAIQEPSVLINNPNGQAIAENISTFLILKNSRANQDEYAKLGFTDREIEWIKSSSAEREIMVKRHSGESIILNIDMSNLHELIHLYSGKLTDIVQAHLFQEQYQEKWVERYLDWKTGEIS